MYRKDQASIQKRQYEHNLQQKTRKYLQYNVCQCTKCNKQSFSCICYNNRVYQIFERPQIKVAIGSYKVPHKLENDYLLEC